MKSRLFKAIILGLVIGVLGLLLSPFRFALNLEENTGLGLLFKLRGVEKPSGEVVVVSTTLINGRALCMPASWTIWLERGLRSSLLTSISSNRATPKTTNCLPSRSERPAMLSSASRWLPGR